MRITPSRASAHFPGRDGNHRRHGARQHGLQLRRQYARGVPMQDVASLPDEQRAMGALQGGDRVLALNEATGMLEADPVTHVWVNHDPGASLSFPEECSE